ncbi:hypothetical protein ACT2CQ_00160 [Candidatus Karelsulcia muelleri]
MKTKNKSRIESQLKYIYRLQLIHLRFKYLNNLIKRFTFFLIRFLFFLKHKKKYLFVLANRLKKKKKQLIIHSNLNIYKNKIIKLLNIKSLTKQKLKKLELDIEYNSIDFILKKRKLLKKKNNLMIKSIKIKNIKKYIRLKEILFKTKFINYKKNKEEINKKILFLKEIENKIKQKINRIFLKRYQHLFKSGIAVVPVYEKIPYGTYILITQQKYYELLERKKIIIEENRGRILIDFYLANKENNKMNKILFNFS